MKILLISILCFSFTSTAFSSEFACYLVKNSKKIADLKLKEGAYRLEALDDDLSFSVRSNSKNLKSGVIDISILDTKSYKVLAAYSGVAPDSSLDLDGISSTLSFLYKSETYRVMCTQSSEQ